MMLLRNTASVAEGEIPWPRSVLSPDIGNRVRAHERRRQYGPSLGDREVVESRGGSRRIAGYQGLGCLRIEPVSPADQERSFVDLDVLIAGMAVRWDAIPVRHGNPESELAGASWITADDGDERPGWQHRGHDPV